MCEKGFPFAGAHQQKHAQRQLLCCVIKQNLDNLLANLALLNLSCATHLIRIYRKLFCWCLDRNLCCRRLRAMRPRDVAHLLEADVRLQSSFFFPGVPDGPQFFSRRRSASRHGIHFIAFVLQLVYDPRLFFDASLLGTVFRYSLFGVVLLDVAHHGCIAFSLHPTIREKALQTRRICLRVVRWVGVLSWCCGCCSGHGRDGEKLCD